MVQKHDYRQWSINIAEEKTTSVLCISHKKAVFRYNLIVSAPNTLATLYILIRCLLEVLVVMRLLLHVDKCDYRFTGLSVKYWVHQCKFPPLLLYKRTWSSNPLFGSHFGINMTPKTYSYRFPIKKKKLAFSFFSLESVVKWHIVGNYFPLVSGYLELARKVFSGGQDFHISMDFRTDQLNALLFFSYNTQTEDYILVRSRDDVSNHISNRENTQTEVEKNMTQHQLVIICLSLCILRWSWRVVSCPSFLLLKVMWLNWACGWGSATAMETGSGCLSRNVARSSLLQLMTGQRRQGGEEQGGWESTPPCTWGAYHWTLCILLWTAEVTNTVRRIYFMSLRHPTVKHVKKNNKKLYYV